MPCWGTLSIFEQLAAGRFVTSSWPEDSSSGSTYKALSGLNTGAVVATGLVKNVADGLVGDEQLAISGQGKYGNDRENR